jgi:phenylacetate-coenzyme A ligase PaaK-like adenylate-forming protein
MTVAEKAGEQLVGQITFPLTNFIFNRRKIMPQFRYLRASEWYEAERLRDLQLHKLRQLVSYACERVPFYTKRFKAIGLEPEDVLSLEVLNKVPPLTRQEVIDHRHEMVDRAFTRSVESADRSKTGPGEPILFAPFRRHKLVRNTSSGSTGAPTVFYEDGSRTALNWALELRLKNWFNIRPGAREARMVRLSSDYLPTSRVLRLRNRLWNQLIVPGVNLTDDDYAVSVEQIAKFRPKVLWGFTSALAGLADYLRRKDISPSPWGIQLITGWAAPVYDHERRVLKEVFSCAVSNIYSAREVGHIAGQCACGEFHINQEHSLVERDDAGGGELLVTSLDISPMPFIRYRMGDIGWIADSTCECGRKLQVLRNFLGRTGEVYRTRDGRMISPNFWCRTFMNVKLSEAVKRFQVVYVRDDFMRIRIVKSPFYTQSTEQLLRDHLEKNFPRDMSFEFAYVAEIRPQVSGKYRMVVNEIAGREEQ